MSAIRYFMTKNPAVLQKLKKRLVRKTPARMVNWYRRTFKNLDAGTIFTTIYDRKLWGGNGSVSGPGSEPSQTGTLIKELDRLFERMDIRSLLDVPCGDFNWMQKVDLAKIDYLGGDIVAALIAANKKKFPRHFAVIDLLRDALPAKDLILVRDCFVHLSYREIFQALRNIKKSGCKYLLTTTFTDCRTNKDIFTGNWRKLNLQEKPFDFPDPILVINENCSEGNGNNRDKSMALWEIGAL
jgi:hypothetical protein